MHRYAQAVKSQLLCLPLEIRWVGMKTAHLDDETLVSLLMLKRVFSTMDGREYNYVIVEPIDFWEQSRITPYRTVAEEDRRLRPVRKHARKTHAVPGYSNSLR